MPFEPGLSRSWYNKGKKAAKNPKWADMYDAWHWVKGKPTISGNRVTAQESFYQGWFDGTQRNPSKRSVRKRVAAALKKFVRGNPHRVKGRKVKGGRAVTLKNMKSVTIIRHSNGAVSVRGVQLKGRKG